ncbi:MAG: hypothetical protein AAF662_07875 [Pseudomonadota bacterium]
MFSIHTNLFSTAECNRLLQRVPKRNDRLDPDQNTLALAGEIVKRMRFTDSMQPLHALVFFKDPDCNWSTRLHQDFALPAFHRPRDDVWSSPSKKSGRMYMKASKAVLQYCINVRLSLSLPSEGDIYFSRTRIDDPVRPTLYPGSALAFSPLTFHGSKAIEGNADERHAIQYLFAPSRVIEKHNLLPLVA